MLSTVRVPGRGLVSRARARAGSRPHDEQGAVAVMVALLSLLLFMIAALVVDLGQARDMRAAQQNAADAGALAGATALYASGSTPAFSTAVSTVESYVQSNTGTPLSQWASCTDAGRPAAYYVPSGSTPCISFDSSTAPTIVRVVVPTRQVTLGLGALASNSKSIPVGAMAEASVGSGASTYACGFCVLGTSGTTTTAGGSTMLTVNNTGLYLNGRADFSGNTTIAVNNGTFKVQQAPQLSGSYSLTPNPTVTGKAVADPLASLAMPSLTGLPDRGSPNFSGQQSCNLSPGAYGSLSISGNVTCNLSPGVYVFTGSFNPSGNTAINALGGVTLYFACGSSSAPRTCNNSGGGSMSISGTVQMQIKPPTSGPTQGIALLYDRGNTNTLNYTGTNDDLWYGTIYAASANFVMGGTATSTNFDSMVVVKSLNLSGNASITTNYTTGNNVPVSGGAGVAYLSQ